MFKPPAVQLGVGAPSFEDVVNVARHNARVELTPVALDAIGATRAIVDALAGDVHPHYGISTGFGALATLPIPREKRVQLQRSNGGCWETHYSTARVNDGTTFKADSD